RHLDLGHAVDEMHDRDPDGDLVTVIEQHLDQLTIVEAGLSSGVCVDVGRDLGGGPIAYRSLPQLVDAYVRGRLVEVPERLIAWRQLRNRSSAKDPSQRQLHQPSRAVQRRLA